jgi:hypothetical protein
MNLRFDALPGEWSDPDPDTWNRGSIPEQTPDAIEALIAAVEALFDADTKAPHAEQPASLAA